MPRRTLAQEAGAALSAQYRRYVASLVLFHLSVAERCGLNATDYQALNLLQLEGPLPASELARRLGLTKGATTRAIDRLVDAGYAQRQVDAQDRRVVRVGWTGRQPDGLDERLAPVREGIGLALRDLDSEALRGLQRYLEAAARVYADASLQLAAEG
jgi:DNA-binding MarR family transcriptional regulator